VYLKHKYKSHFKHLLLNLNPPFFTVSDCACENQYPWVRIPYSVVRKSRRPRPKPGAPVKLRKVADALAGPKEIALSCECRAGIYVFITFVTSQVKTVVGVWVYPLP